MKEITLTPERREALCREVQKTFSVAFDETLSDFRAGEIVDLMLKTMGPAVYNQAVPCCCQALPPLRLLPVPLPGQTKNHPKPLPTAMPMPAMNGGI
jgi:uncharacterized protein (DUF2164 family)